MKNLKSIVASTLFTAALAVPMASWAANFCAAPTSTASVTFGAGPAPSHQLDPEEVTITKGGTVTITVAGGGHFISIYPVSRNTTRMDIEMDLLDPLDSSKNCVEFAPGETACTANSRYLVTDGSGKLVLDTGVNTANANDFNRVNFASGATTALAAGSVINNKFFKTGRYMIVCDNRGHSIPTPFMFGFVNVVNCDNLNDE